MARAETVAETVAEAKRKPHLWSLTPMTDQLRPRVAAFLAAWVAYDAADDNGTLYRALLEQEAALSAADWAELDGAELVLDVVATFAEGADR